MNSTNVSETIVQEIRITAPAERVFEALTNPEQRVAWWGSEGRFQTTHVESDLRPGGKWMMRGTGIGGKPFKATETLVRFDLTEKDGMTTVRLTHSGLTSEGARAHKGWPQILEWLRAYSER